ncbi:MAG: pyridoxal phosphate-dependent aminotransferase [Lachnospiraceae bacterium]|nr:pyridoxal phosphate-dependent aminotransferase [Lachnospiraceae bacterium]
MEYNFDTVYNRKGTMSLKYDFAKERGKKEEMLPLWVADMDFQTAPDVLKQLAVVVERGIFGYSEAKTEYFKAVRDWFRNHFEWETKEEWLIKTPGVVFAIAAAIRAFTKEGDAVMIQQPVYYPFQEVIEDNRRTLVNSPLRLKDGRYEIDFEDFERKIADHQVKLFLLCSPHNPVGRVWKEEELRKIGEICLRYGVLVVSDEIHADFTYPGHKHLVFASLKKAYADITVTCTAPTKTFNLAGLQISNIFISNPRLREKMKKEISAAGYSQVNQMGLVACQAAYEKGEEWLTQLKQYLNGNLRFVKEYVEEKIPQVQLVEPEGTYLIWLDFRKINLTKEERDELIEEKAGLWLDSGAMFGAHGEGFERVNIACPRSILKQALDQLKEAVDQLTESAERFR